MNNSFPYLNTTSITASSLNDFNDSCALLEPCDLTEALWTLRGLPQGLFYFFIIVFSIFGNTVVIKTIIQDAEMSKSYSNIFLINLALCDLAQAGLMLPIFGTSAVLSDAYIFPPIFGYDVMCTLSRMLNQLCPAVTSYTNTIIAFDRGIAFVYPFRRRLTHLTAFIIMALTWVSSFVFSSDVFCKPVVIEACWSGCSKRICINDISPQSWYLGLVSHALAINLLFLCQTTIF